MLLFDVKCRVREAIHVTDETGTDITIKPGSYHLLGLDHLVHGTDGITVRQGTDLQFVVDGDHGHPYRISSESLAHLMALDEVEIVS